MRLTDQDLYLSTLPTYHQREVADDLGRQTVRSTLIAVATCPPGAAGRLGSGTCTRRAARSGRQYVHTYIRYCTYIPTYVHVPTRERQLMYSRL